MRSDGQSLRRELWPELSLVEAASHAEVQGLKKSQEGSRLRRGEQGPHVDDAGRGTPAQG